MRTVSEIPDGSDALHGAITAADYYAGQMTALYALRSTGALEIREHDGLDQIRREVAAAIQCAETHHPDDVDALQAFAHWLCTH